MQHPLVSVIILNNHRLDNTLACLASLSQSDYQNIRITLLDLSSGVGAIEIVQRDYPDVQAISLKENLGYAGNNNIGIKSAISQGTDWVFILNDDTVLDPSCISSLIEAVTNDPVIGIAGPMVYHYDEPDVIQSAGGMLGKYWKNVHLGQNEMDCGQFDSVRLVEWVSGCAMLVKRTLIEQIGLLDERYFLYWEEIEWCIRATRSGWKIAHVPHAKLWHKGVNRNYQAKTYVTYFVTRNQLLTLAKHKAPLIAWIYTYAQTIRTLASWTFRPRWKSKREHRNAMWKGLVHFLQHRFGSIFV